MTTSRRISHTLSSFGALCLLLAALALPASAQNNKGTIVGTVTDPNGALVAGAKVTVINNATGVTRDATSSEDGTYTVPNLEPGNYRVTVDAQGFQSVVVESVQLETNARQPVDVKFGTVAGGSATVTVEAEAPVVESETSVRGDLITGRQVTELPISQRNFTLLAGLSPGVSRPVVGTLGGATFASNGPTASTESTRFRESGGSVIVANGARPTNNNFTLDGIDNNETQFGQIAIYPNPDAIAEFKIETSVPSAESGRAGGAVISTTFKSGSNDVHGTAYEFYQGRFWSAKPADKPNPTNYVTHNFGGVVGGPIFLPRPGEGGPMFYNGRNRSFFFFSYNGQRNSTPAFKGTDSPFVTVPTVRQRAGDFSEQLVPGNLVTFNTINGPVIAPQGTIFNAAGVPFPGNVIPLALQSTAARNLLNAYPLPTNGARVSNYRRNRKEKLVQDSYDIRIDHTISGSDSIFGRYSKSTDERSRDNNFPLGTSPNGNDLASGFGAGTEFGNARQVALGETHIFSPTVINDMRGGYHRVNIGIFNPGVGGALGFSPSNSADLGIPNVNVCGLPCTGTLLIGVIGTDDAGRGNDRDLEFVGDGGPFTFLSNNYFFGDTLTVVRGNHTYKIGGDLRVRQNQNIDAGRGGGTKGNLVYGSGVGGFASGNYAGIAIGPRDSGSSYANLLLGYPPASISRGNGGGGPYLQSNKEISFYVQDDWKVRSDLTLNLGLRYDLFTPRTERFDRQVNFDPVTSTLVRAGEGAPGGRGLANTDKNNFGPRIGFAYSYGPEKHFIIRGGYGLLYAVDVTGQPPLYFNPPFSASYSASLNNYGTAGSPVPANFNLDTGYPFPTPGAIPQPGARFAVPSAFETLFYIAPNNKTPLFHQYNLTFQYGFWNDWLAEAGYVGSLGRNLTVVQNIGRSGSVGPGSREVTTVEVINAVLDLASSRYDSLQMKLEKRLSRGLSILSTYTWAHAIDDSPGNFAGQSRAARDRYGYSNPLRPELDRGNSDFDIRHRFTFSNVYDLPFGRGRRYLSGVSRWANLFVGGFQLNNIVTIQSGPVYSIITGENGPRPDIIGDPTPTAAQRALGLEYNPAAFRAPTTRIFVNDATSPTYGNLGRNTFRGQRQEYWDASLFKNLILGEVTRIQLRLQVFNVLNHVNRFVPERDFTFALDPNTGRQAGRDIAISTPRQLEFGFKFIF
ncbi:MAG TPA: carboxypeptidase-like regulatory domain-containing protein [Pyrinomonadaceae bacterium]|jgi:hypothetical protein